MGRRGRLNAAFHGRRAAQADMALEASFYQLANAVVEWLDNGNYAAFSGALEALDMEYFDELDPVDPAAPKDTRIAVLASRYAAAIKALSDFRLVDGLIAQRRDMALAELIATVAEPSPVPLYWQKLVKRIQAEGIVQREVHPSSRALARHLANSIREFNTKGGVSIDETYSDVPLDSWAELPREFAGFRLIDMDPDDPFLELNRFIHSLPPSTDIAFYTAGRIAPPQLSGRRATYLAWNEVIAAWDKRNGSKLNHQQPAIWAMLLANRITEDNSDVSFYDRQLIESPWKRDGVVMIKVVEDDLPPEYR